METKSKVKIGLCSVVTGLYPMWKKIVRGQEKLLQNLNQFLLLT